MLNPVKTNAPVNHKQSLKAETTKQKEAEVEFKEKQETGEGITPKEAAKKLTNIVSDAIEATVDSIEEKKKIEEEQELAIIEHNTPKEENPIEQN